jgi:molecular chaperone GrpE
MSHSKHKPHAEPTTAEDVSIAATGEDQHASETQLDPLAQAEHAAARLEAELAEAKDKALRSQAELENVRKRLRKELEDERRYAETALLGDLLSVVDNLARAVEAGEKATDVAGLLAGVKLVAQQLDGVLKRHHCERIPALGEPFDPNVHQAISKQASGEQPPNTIVIVAQEGYKLHDRVLRPSQVVVSAAPEQT